MLCSPSYAPRKEDGESQSGPFPFSGTVQSGSFAALNRGLVAGAAGRTDGVPRGQIKTDTEARGTQFIRIDEKFGDDDQRTSWSLSRRSSRRFSFSLASVELLSC